MEIVICVVRGLSCLITAGIAWHDIFVVNCVLKVFIWLQTMEFPYFDFDLYRATYRFMIVDLYMAWLPDMTLWKCIWL